MKNNFYAIMKLLPSGLTELMGVCKNKWWAETTVHIMNVSVQKCRCWIRTHPDKTDYDFDYAYSVKPIDITGIGNRHIINKQLTLGQLKKQIYSK